MTGEALGWAYDLGAEQGYRDGLGDGTAIGAVAALTPDRRDRAGYRDRSVARRIAEMEICAERIARRHGRPLGYEYRGGPVRWEDGPRITPPFAERDRAAIEAGQRIPPFGGGEPSRGNPAPPEWLAGWRQVRPWLSATAWERVWYDLHPAVRDALQDLAPAPAQLEVRR